MNKTKERLEEIVKEDLDKYNLEINSIYEDEEDGHKFIRVELLGKNITSGLIAKISKPISKAFDELDPVDESYILDIYGKEEDNE